MNNTAILFGVILIVVVAGFFVFSNLETSNFRDVPNDGLSGEFQKVTLSQDDLNYEDAYAEAGKPIAISVDSSVKGCLRSVAFNVEGKRYVKYLKSNSDTLVLPALEKGTYPFSCSMGMGFGKLVVRDG